LYTELLPLLSSCREVFIFIQTNINIIQSISSFDCFHLYLHVAVVADRCSQLADKTSGSTRDFPVICYEFMTHALKVYDECSVDHSARKITYLHTLIGTLLECRCFDVHDYDNLSTRLAQYAARLLRKADQCKLLLKCAHLFYNCGMKVSSHFFVRGHSSPLLIILTINGISDRMKN
jgi:vacuolar protein sorting-associated protein 35